MGNNIVTVRIMGSNYRAAQVGREKIETDRLKYTRYNHFVDTLMIWRKIWLKPNSPEYEIAVCQILKFESKRQNSDFET